MKISYDYDGVLSEVKYLDQAREQIAKGDTVYIISARGRVEPMEETARKVGIPSRRIYATGHNALKINKIRSLGIERHYDNNPDVVKALPGIGTLVQ